MTRATGAARGAPRKPLSKDKDRFAVALLFATSMPTMKQIGLGETANNLSLFLAALEHPGQMTIRDRKLGVRFDRRDAADIVAARRDTLRKKLARCLTQEDDRHWVSQISLAWASAFMVPDCDAARSIARGFCSWVGEEAFFDGVLASFIDQRFGRDFVPISKTALFPS
jgi:hypothetical protein